MTEKGKLIELIKQNGVYNGRSMGIEYYVVKPEWLADTLIENGIGDISEWKEKYARLEKSELEKYKRALSCACKVSAAIPTKELVKARVDCFLRQAEKEIEEEADEKL